MWGVPFLNARCGYETFTAAILILARARHIGHSLNGAGGRSRLSEHDRVDRIRAQLFKVTTRGSKRIRRQSS